MAATGITTWIVCTVRSAIAQAVTVITGFIAALPVFDAAILAAVVCGAPGFISGARP